jgi:protein TonB
MLKVLLESRAPRQRRLASTIASAIMHGGLIAGAVALTLPGPVNATAATREEPIFRLRTPQPTVRRPESAARRQDVVREQGIPSVPVIHVPTDIPDRIPPVDIGPERPTDDVVIGGPGLNTRSPIGDGGALGGTPGSAMDERLVDRAPHLLGRAIEPRYPAALREAGVQGRVVVQFVVDTLGRAELDELQVVESAHPQFVEAIRTALGRYRFSPGEAGGRKVRTRVQLPFDFALVR